MSWKRKFKCKECSYSADIYEGKGFMGQEIVSVSCPECHSIQPLVVGGVIGQSAPSFRSLVDRLCLNCGSSQIKKWDGKTCPKCGGEMQPTEDKEFWT